MYAIYSSDQPTFDSLRLFGVVKFECVARDFAQSHSFKQRWRRYQIRYCRSPYLDGSIPPHTVFCRKSSSRVSYFGFFKTSDDARHFANFMKTSYPGIEFFVGNILKDYELRTSHMDSESTLF